MHFDNSIPSRRLNIAVIGTGIAGMSAAWLLSKAHNVTVFEKAARVGGHSNTVEVAGPDGLIPVDTGFIVYNPVNYPNLVALFDHLGVPTKPSDMSFGASIDDGALEYGSDGLFAQRRNLLRPRFWRMARDVLRFYREAPAFIHSPQGDSLSLGEYIDREDYSKPFVYDHLLPMGAAIWSTPAADIRNYPARAFLNFFKNHGLLQVRGRPQWRTVDGGSREYVRRLTAPYADRIVLHSRVRGIRRQSSGAVVAFGDGYEEAYDHVVVATHADQALALLSDADGHERAILSGFPYTKNKAVLHQDTSLMPKRKAAWSSWNYLSGRGADGSAEVCVTYWMNRLQSLDDGVPLFVTLNPHRRPAAEKTLRDFVYDHPIYDHQSIQSQKDLWRIQGGRRTWFCGSYCGYGFHEDALQAGLAVAESIGGVERPWRVEGASDRIYFPATPQQQVAA